MFGGTGRTSVGSWVGVKVRNVAGREIASFPNPLCVFWPDWPPRSPASLALDRRTVSPSLAFWLLGEAAEETKSTGIHFSGLALLRDRRRASREIRERGAERGAERNDMSDMDFDFDREFDRGTRSGELTRFARPECLFTEIVGW